MYPVSIWNSIDGFEKNIIILGGGIILGYVVWTIML